MQKKYDEEYDNEYDEEYEDDDYQGALSTFVDMGSKIITGIGAFVLDIPGFLSAILTKINFWNPMDKYPENLTKKCELGKIPVKELKWYAESNNPRNREAAARASNATDNIHKILATDENSKIRFYVAYHSKCPEVLEYLSDDDEYFVKGAVLTNDHCPIRTRKKLMMDEDCQSFIGDIPELTADEIRSCYSVSYSVKHMLCKKQKLPEDVIKLVIAENNPKLIESMKNNFRISSNKLVIEA